MTAIPPTGHMRELAQVAVQHFDTAIEELGNYFKSVPVHGESAKTGFITNGANAARSGAGIISDMPGLQGPAQNVMDAFHGFMNSKAYAPHFGQAETLLDSVHSARSQLLELMG